MDLNAESTGVYQDKMAFFAYQPWYGNPVENGDIGWYNWAWGGGPEGMNHNPATILPNGQRDVASVLYPIIGAYSSTDESVLRYQFEISKAAHIDGFMINDYGKEISQNYRKCVEKMLDLAEEYDMKICLQYDAKIHFANWVPSTKGKNRAEKIQGIIDDIEYILKNYASKKSYLKFNDIPIINPFGTNLLSDKEWGEIKQQVEADGYGKFFLMADRAPAPSGGATNIDGAYNWIQLDEKMKPESNPTYDSVYKWAVTHNRATYNWAKRDFENRFAVGCVWPGFDDTGVGGDWGSGKPRRFAFLNGDPKGSALMAIQNSILDTMPDWILYATFNDWNEATVIEPSVEFGYRYIKEVQRFLELFKGLEAADENLMQKITDEYLSSRCSVTGPESVTIYEGDDMTSLDGFVITGKEPVTVTITGIKGVTWNNSTKTLDIAPGLEPGKYNITLKAVDGNSPDALFKFILTVKGAAFAPTTSENESNIDGNSDNINIKPNNSNNIKALITAAVVLTVAAVGAVVFFMKKRRKK